MTTEPIEDENDKPDEVEDDEGSDFTVTLLGKTFDEDALRNAFEVAVNAIRSALEEAGLSGELVIAGVTYSVDEVPDDEGEEEADG
jgi:20S proteasome alpha/beta subunit